MRIHCTFTYFKLTFIFLQLQHNMQCSKKAQQPQKSSLQLSQGHLSWLYRQRFSVQLGAHKRLILMIPQNELIISSKGIITQRLIQSSLRLLLRSFTIANYRFSRQILRQLHHEVYFVFILKFGIDQILPLNHRNIKMHIMYMQHVNNL